MYAIANEKSLRLVYETFYLAIFTVFFDFLRGRLFLGEFTFDDVAKSRLISTF